VLGDDEFGRARAFRDAARALSKSYLVDVPRSTKVRSVRRGTEGTLERKQRAVEELRRRIPVDDWAYFPVRDGEKGLIEVRATMLPVATEREGQPWVQETLVLIETLDGLDHWHCLGHAPMVPRCPARRVRASGGPATASKRPSRRRRRKSVSTTSKRGPGKGGTIT
jgi:hypothetical protein